MREFKQFPRNNPEFVYVRKLTRLSRLRVFFKKYWRTFIPLFILLFFISLSIWGAREYLSYNNKKNSRKNYIQGLKNLNDGNFDEATKSLEKSIKGSGNNIESLTQLGVSKYNQGDYSGAITTYLEALEIDSRNTAVINSLGNVYRDQKNFEKAQKEYEKAIQINPFFSPAYTNLAIMLFDLGKKADALEIVQKGLEKIPDSQELKNIRTLFGPNK